MDATINNIHGFDIINYKDLIAFYISELVKLDNGNKVKMIDVGGGDGFRKDFKEIYNYADVVIYEKFKQKNLKSKVIYGDICEVNQKIPDGYYDAVICLNVLEHVQTPWTASTEIMRMLKPGGVFFIMTPFVWHYHPCPIDYWRFTPEGLEALFCKSNSGITLKKGFMHFLWDKKEQIRVKKGIESYLVGRKNEI